MKTTKTMKTLAVACALSLTLGGATVPAHAEDTDAGTSAGETTTTETTDTGSTDTTERVATLADMHRLYNPYTGEHLYTASANERDTLVEKGWTSEGVGWIAPVKSNTPVYRLYNKYAPGGDHHYTMNATERDTLVEKGWTDEGVGWYSDDEEGVQLLRQYNSFAKTGIHNYTTKQKENDDLVKLGWDAEGTAWYGVNHTHDWRPVYTIIHHDAVTEEQPIYETKEIAVCSVCNADLTDFSNDEISAHEEAHALKHEGSGWHSGGVKSVITGYRTVTIQNAYDEQIIDHYSCSCGATK